jgi:hypothetical protein
MTKQLATNEINDSIKKYLLRKKIYIKIIYHKTVF